MSDDGTAADIPAAKEPTAFYVDYEKAGGADGFGLTFSRSPDGQLIVKEVKPGSVAYTSQKFAPGQVLINPIENLEALNEKLKSPCTVKVITVDGATKSAVSQPDKTAQEIDSLDLYGIAQESNLDGEGLEKKFLLKERDTVEITVGPKPLPKPVDLVGNKFTGHNTVNTILGKFKGIDDFLEGIQGQIGLPFGNIERGMELEVKSDTQRFGASNNAGNFEAEAEYEFVASDHLRGDFTGKVPGYYKDGEKPRGGSSATSAVKPRNFVPLKVFLYATCAKPLQVSRPRAGSDTKGYRGNIPDDLKQSVLAVLLRRAREAVLTGDALKNARNMPKLKGLVKVVDDKEGGRAVLQKLRDVIFEAFRDPANPIDKTHGLPSFNSVATRVVKLWQTAEFDPPPEQTSAAKENQKTQLGEGAEGSTQSKDVVPAVTQADRAQRIKKLAESAEIDVKCLEALALLARKKLREAGLTREEVIGLRLYTGPLFVKMNGALRDSLRGGKNKRYTNIIFAATSGLVKLSKVSPVPEGRVVYRGLSGIELPREFWETDTQGVKGGVEMAFLSTTTNMEVAIDYSNSSGPEKMPFIFELEVGAIDKGAALSFLSQFPEEDEILMPPRSFLEVVKAPKRIDIPEKLPKTGTRHIWAIPVKINCNVQNFNIENFAKARQALLLSTVDQAIMEVREELSQMSSDIKYLERAEREDDLEFAKAPQVLIYDDREHPLEALDHINSTPSSPVAAERPLRTSNPDKKDEPWSLLEDETLSSFLLRQFQRHCPDGDISGSASSTPAGNTDAKNSGTAASAGQGAPKTVSRDVWPVTESANKLPRLIVLVVTDTLAKNTKLVTNLRALKEEKGVVVIAVLAPGYRKPDPDAWWPPSMGFLHDCKYVDLRDQDAWDRKCDEELVPLVRKRALLSRGKPEEYLLDLIKEEADRSRQTFADEDPAWFNDDFNFRLSMQEALNLHSTAISKLNLYIEEPSRGLRWTVDLPPRTSQRLLIGRQRRMLAEHEEKRFERNSTETALALCKMTHAAKGHSGVEFLTSGGGDKTQKLFTWSPLMLHAADGNPELVQLLLAGKAQVNRQEDEKGYTALRLAAEYGCRSVVQVLLEHKASPLIVDKTDSTAFLRSSENGHVEVLKLLYKHEPAVLDRANNINYTPLMAAVKQHHIATVQWLLENKAGVNTLTTDSQKSALMIAAESREPENALVKLLLQHKADPKQETAKGMTALMSAIVKKNVARVELLLAFGADPGIKKTVEAQKKRQKQQIAADMQAKKGANSHGVDKRTPDADNQENKSARKEPCQKTAGLQDSNDANCQDEWQPPPEIDRVMKLWDELDAANSQLDNSERADPPEKTAQDLLASEQQELREITKLLRDAMPHEAHTPAADDKKSELAGWRTSDVKKLLQDPELGSSFAEAVGVVDKFKINGGDLEELLRIPGREHNPLYLPVSEGGLGLAEIQVIKLKRELARRCKSTQWWDGRDAVGSKKKEGK